MGFGSGVLLGDHAHTPGSAKFRLCTPPGRISTAHLYVLETRVQQYSLSPELCSVGSCP